MDDADPRAKLEPFQVLIGEWTIELTHPMLEDTTRDTVTTSRSPTGGLPGSC